MIPMTPLPDDVTELLVAWEHGDQAALDKLMPLVYEELRRQSCRQPPFQAARDR
jgi:hypothetical protein